VWDRALAAGPTPDVRERIEEMRIDVAVEERGGDA
jgi:hypothetical protein